MNWKTTLLAIASAVPGASAAQQHPSLFFGPSDVASLQARAASTHQGIWTTLRGAADQFLGTDVDSAGNVTGPLSYNLGDRRDIGNSLVLFAFVAAVDGGPGYVDLARRWLLDVVAFGNLDLDGTHDLVQAHLLAGAAIAYDWLWPQLGDAQRASVRQVLASNATSLMASGQAGNWWAPEWLGNHNWIDHAAVGIAGLALRGEVDDAATSAWIGFTVDNARHIKAISDGISDGTWHEGFSYSVYGFQWHLPFVAALERAGLDSDGLADLVMLRGYGRMRAAAQIPEAPSNYVLAYGDHLGFQPTEALLPLRWAAARYRDGVAQAAADRWIAGTPRARYAPEINDQVFEFLFYDPSVPSVDLHSLPLDWAGADAQAVVFRSSWDAGGTIFALKAGPYGGKAAWAAQVADPSFGLNFGHDHADDNGFYLYGNGSWLAPEAEGYYIGHPDSPPPQANKTVFHNALVIDGQGQLGDGVRANDDEGRNYDWFPDRDASIPVHLSSVHFAYALGDGARLYPASLGLTRWDRHVLFLDRRFVLLRDVVDATQPHDYHSVVHFMDGAAQDGTWIRGTGKNGAALGVAVVSPPGFALSTYSQTAAHMDEFDPDQSIWAAEVSPASPAASATFLWALVPTTTAAWASRPAVAALDPAVPDAGLTLADGARVATALFDALPAQTRRAGGWRLDGLAGVAEAVAGVPARALLVQGTLLADATRTLLSTDGLTGLLEADGLDQDVLALSGDLLHQATVFAPRATQVTWWGQAVPFTRSGDLVLVNVPPTPAPSDPPRLQPAGGGSKLLSGCSAGGTTGALALLGLLGRWRSRRRRR